MQSHYTCHNTWFSLNLVWLPNWSWWRHQMETFSVLLALCAGNSPVTDEFPSQRPVTRSFDVFIDLRLNKRLCKQSWHRWFETPSRSLLRHCDILLGSCDLAICIIQDSWSNPTKYGYIQTATKHNTTDVHNYQIVPNMSFVNDKTPNSGLSSQTSKSRA